MTKNILSILSKYITPTTTNYLVKSMISPLAVWFNSSVNFWKIKIIPNPNPYTLFSSLTRSSTRLNPLQIRGLKNLIRTNSQSENITMVRDAMRKNFQNDVSSIQDLKKLRQQLYYSENFETSKGLKALVEVDAKLYLYYKQKGLTKQMKQQLDLTLIWINKFKLKYPEDSEIRQFELNQLSSLYEKANILKAQKNKGEYISVLEKLYKLQLNQQESVDKQRRCNRVLRKICLHYLMQKDVNSMMDYYIKVQNDSQRRIVRHYMADLNN